MATRKKATDKQTDEIEEVEEDLMDETPEPIAEPVAVSDAELAEAGMVEEPVAPPSTPAEAGIRRRIDRRAARSRNVGGREDRAPAADSVVQQAFMCPNNSHVVNPHTGSCLNCGMKLI